MAVLKNSKQHSAVSIQQNQPQPPHTPNRTSSALSAFSATKFWRPL